MEPGHEGADRELSRLSRAECLRLLATVQTGRIVFTIRALPAVRVMNFVLMGDLIIIRTAADSAVAQRAAGSVVAFEADHTDALTSSGWSVTVTGRAELVTDPHEIAGYQSLPLVRWPQLGPEVFLRVRLEAIEGQQVANHAVVAAPAPPVA